MALATGARPSKTLGRDLITMGLVTVSVQGHGPGPRTMVPAELKASRRPGGAAAGLVGGLGLQFPNTLLERFQLPCLLDAGQELPRTLHEVCHGRSRFSGSS